MSFVFAQSIDSYNANEYTDFEQFITPDYGICGSAQWTMSDDFPLPNTLCQNGLPFLQQTNVLSWSDGNMTVYSRSCIWVDGGADAKCTSFQTHTSANNCTPYTDIMANNISSRDIVISSPSVGVHLNIPTNNIAQYSSNPTNNQLNSYTSGNNITLTGNVWANSYMRVTINNLSYDQQFVQYRDTVTNTNWTIVGWKFFGCNSNTWNISNPLNWPQNQWLTSFWYDVFDLTWWFVSTSNPDSQFLAWKKAYRGFNVSCEVCISSTNLQTNCPVNHTWNATSQTCVPNTRVIACTWTLPTHSTPPANTSITQTRNGGSNTWLPDNTWTYSATPSANSCQYTCPSGTNTNCEMIPVNPNKLLKTISIVEASRDPTYWDLYDLDKKDIDPTFMTLNQYLAKPNFLRFVGYTGYSLGTAIWSIFKLDLIGDEFSLMFIHNDANQGDRGLWPSLPLPSLNGTITRAIGRRGYNIDYPSRYITYYNWYRFFRDIWWEYRRTIVDMWPNNSTRIGSGTSVLFDWYGDFEYNINERIDIEDNQIKWFLCGIRNGVDAWPITSQYLRSPFGSLSWDTPASVWGNVCWNNNSYIIDTCRNNPSHTRAVQQNECTAYPSGTGSFSYTEDDVTNGDISFSGNKVFIPTSVPKWGGTRQDIISNSPPINAMVNGEIIHSHPVYHNCYGTRYYTWYNGWKTWNCTDVLPRDMDTLATAFTWDMFNPYDFRKQMLFIYNSGGIAYYCNGDKTQCSRTNINTHYNIFPSDPSNPWSWIKRWIKRETNAYGDAEDSWCTIKNYSFTHIWWKLVIGGHLQNDAVFTTNQCDIP